MEACCCHAWSEEQAAAINRQEHMVLSLGNNGRRRFRLFLPLLLPVPPPVRLSCLSEPTEQEGRHTKQVFVLQKCPGIVGMAGVRRQEGEKRETGGERENALLVEGIPEREPIEFQAEEAGEHAYAAYAML